MTQKDELILKNNLKSTRQSKKLSQEELAAMTGVSRNTISSIETGQFCPTAKLAIILCVALDCKFEELFYLQKVSATKDAKQKNAKIVLNPSAVTT